MSSPQHKFEAGTRFTSCHIEQGVQVCKMTKAEGADWIAPALVIAALVAAVFISGWILFSPAPEAKTAAARAAESLSNMVLFVVGLTMDAIRLSLKFLVLGVLFVPMLLLRWIDGVVKSHS
jgi:hypothetical protein